MEIHIDGLRKSYGDREALQGFSLDSGRDWNVLGVLGRNGAGKTTLLRILVGLLDSDGGCIRIRLDDCEYNWLDPKRAVFVPEDQNLLSYVTARQYLRIYESLNALTGVRVDNGFLERMCREFDLSDALDVAISKMSKGMRRKLELAAAFSSDVPLVVADEMVEGLDVPSMKALSACTRSLTESGRKLLFSTHDLSFLQNVSDNAVVIDKGICQGIISSRDDPFAFSEKVHAAFGNAAPPDELAQGS